MAIANLWHSENFPDSAVESIRFKLVLKYAKLVGSDFKVPTRQSIGGALLKLNFQSCYEQNRATLLQEVSLPWYTFYLGLLLKLSSFSSIVRRQHSV